jgi:hypothetical protein
VFSLAVFDVIFYYCSCDCADASVEVSSAPECFVFSSPFLVGAHVVRASAFEQLHAVAYAYRRWDVHEAVHVVVEYAQFDDFYCVPRGGTRDRYRDHFFHAIAFRERVSVLWRPC